MVKVTTNDTQQINTALNAIEQELNKLKQEISEIKTLLQKIQKSE